MSVARCPLSVETENTRFRHYVRQEDGSWLLTVFKGLETTVELRTLSSGLTLSEIYEDVRFGPEEDEIRGQVGLGSSAERRQTRHEDFV